MKASEILTESFLDKFKKLTAEEQKKFIEELEANQKNQKPVEWRDTEPELTGAANAWT